MFLDGPDTLPETDLALAAQKDAGIDPGALAWLLGQFPTHPLPMMLAPLTRKPTCDSFATICGNGSDGSRFPRPPKLVVVGASAPRAS